MNGVANGYNGHSTAKLSAEQIKNQVEALKEVIRVLDDRKDRLVAKKPQVPPAPRPAQGAHTAMLSQQHRPRCAGRSVTSSGPAGPLIAVR